MFHMAAMAEPHEQCTWRMGRDAHRNPVWRWVLPVTHGNCVVLFSARSAKSEASRDRPGINFASATVIVAFASAFLDRCPPVVGPNGPSNRSSTISPRFPRKVTPIRGHGLKIPRTSARTMRGRVRGKSPRLPVSLGPARRWLESDRAARPPTTEFSMPRSQQDTRTA